MFAPQNSANLGSIRAQLEAGRKETRVRGRRRRRPRIPPFQIGAQIGEASDEIRKGSRVGLGGLEGRRLVQTAAKKHKWTLREPPHKAGEGARGQRRRGSTWKVPSRHSQRSRRVPQKMCISLPGEELRGRREKRREWLSDGQLPAATHTQPVAINR